MQFFYILPYVDKIIPEYIQPIEFIKRWFIDYGLCRNVAIFTYIRDNGFQIFFLFGC